MAGNRAITTPPAPAPVIPADAKVEGLPANGPFGRNPAVWISVIMFLANFLVREAVRRGIIPPVTPELQSLADRFGPDTATWFLTMVSGLPFIIQGFWTKMRVFSPHSVYKRYVVPLFHEAPALPPKPEGEPV